MKKQSIVKSLAAVTFSNITTILSGVVVSMLLPKILSVTDYGWYKTFSLYTSYAGFFSLGIIDGIVLKHGGDDYTDLNRPLFRNYFRWYSLLHLFFMLLLFVVSIFVKDNNYRFICIILGIYLVLNNFTGYFQQVSQITQRFKEYSMRKIINSGLKIINVGLLFAWRLVGFDPTYRIYLAFFILSQIGITGWYFITYRGIIFGESIPLFQTKKQIITLSITGFPLLFANLCSTLILSLDSQFVSVLFDTETYAKYAFAYNMLSLVTVAMSAISTVLYPSLKRTTPETMKKTFESLMGIISVVVYAAIIAFFPLCLFVEWFLPKYTESLPIFRIVFPGLALSSSITVVMHNYYKALGKNNVYFRKSIVVLLVSAAANGIAYLAFRSTVSISIASIVTMLFWYLFADQLFVKEYGYERKRNLSYVVIMLIAFYLCSLINNHYIGFFCYASCYVLITYIIHKKTVFVDLKQIIAK